MFLLAHGQPETSALLSVLASGRPCDGFGGFGPFGSFQVEIFRPKMGHIGGQVAPLAHISYL